MDYLATGHLSIEQGQTVVASIAEGCKQAGCALIGGETAEMPQMYKPGELDLAGFCVGAVRKSKLLPRNVTSQDVAIALPSSGIHSNGFSLVRKLLDLHGIDARTTQLTWNLHESGTILNLENSLAAALLTPTRIYVRQLLSAIKENPDAIKALCHITGGGLLENLPRILPEGIAIELNLASWALPSLFVWLAELANLNFEEAMRTFNCGIGMVVLVSPECVEGVIRTLQSVGENAFVIGRTVVREENVPQVQFVCGNALNWGILKAAESSLVRG